MRAALARRIPSRSRARARRDTLPLLVLFLVTAVSAIVPSLLLIWYFWARDAQPEPGRVLAATFGLGVVAVVPVLMIELPLAAAIKQLGDPYARGALEGFLGAAAPEEAFKLLVLLLYCEKHPAFDEPMDGIVYGAVASLGFATLENVLYVGGGRRRAQPGVPSRPSRATPSGARSSATSSARRSSSPAHRGRLIVGGYLLAALLHGVYDTPLMIRTALEKAHHATDASNALLLFTLGALVFSWVFVVRRVRRLHVDQLHVMAVHALQAGAAPPPGVLTATAPTTGARVAGGLMILLGGLLASGGGLMVLGVSLGVMFGKLAQKDQQGLVVGSVLLGVLPLALGVLLFRSGLRWQRMQAPLSPYVAGEGR